MSVEIVKPTEGGVTITLPYNEAEVLLRVVGAVNTGNLTEHAPNLLEVVNSLLQEFGASGNPSVRYGVRISYNQVYVFDNENPPF